jgi:hypothetical protein
MACAWPARASAQTEPVGAAPTLQQFCDGLNASRCTFFRQMQDGVGVGSLITFDDHGREALLIRNEQCLRVDPSTPQAVSAPAEFVVSRGGSREQEIARRFNPLVNIAGAYRDPRVASITVQLIDMFQQSLAVDAARGAFEDTGDRAACRDALRSPRALLIHWQLGARGARYTLRSQSGDPLTLDAELLQAMGFDAAARQHMAGSTSVAFEGSVILAYRAWRPAVVDGESLSLSEAMSEQIERLRLEATTLVTLGEMPDLPWWPPPRPSSRTTLERALFRSDATLGDVADHLMEALRAAGNPRASFYTAPGGFVLVTRLERIDGSARPYAGSARFIEPRPGEPEKPNDPLSFIEALYFAPEGRYRQVMFVVTNQNVGEAPWTLTPGRAREVLEGGSPDLIGPSETTPFSDTYRVTALIYEFRKRGGRQAEVSIPGRWNAQRHLQRSRILAGLSQ